MKTRLKPPLKPVEVSLIQNIFSIACSFSIILFSELLHKTTTQLSWLNGPLLKNRELHDSVFNEGHFKKQQQTSQQNPHLSASTANLWALLSSGGFCNIWKRWQLFQS